jgi:hypothetical protein
VLYSCQEIMPGRHYGSCDDGLPCTCRRCRISLKRGGPLFLATEQLRPIEKGARSLINSPCKDALWIALIRCRASRSKAECLHRSVVLSDRIRAA